MTTMLKEIKETPDAIRKLIKTQGDNIKSIAKEINKRDIDFIVTAARGTSDHSATYGSYIFSIIDGLMSCSAGLSIVTCYNASLNLDKAVVIGISQSGEGPDVCEFIEGSKERGALTVAMVNETDSRLVKAADFIIPLSAGKEIAVAATKSYAVSLAAFYLLAMSLAGKNAEAVIKLNSVADIVDKVLNMEPEIKVLSERYRYMQSGLVVARGVSYCNTLEVSLKLAETCGIEMRGYSSAELLHGPIASIHKSDPVFVLAPSDSTLKQVSEAVSILIDKNAEIIILSDDDEILKLATVPIKMPVCPDFLSPIVYIIIMQIFANYLSVTKGNNPDSPDGLAKVTKTV